MTIEKHLTQYRIRHGIKAALMADEVLSHFSHEKSLSTIREALRTHKIISKDYDTKKGVDYWALKLVSKAKI